MWVTITFKTNSLPVVPIYSINPGIPPNLWEVGGGCANVKKLGRFQLPQGLGVGVAINDWCIIIHVITDVTLNHVRSVLVGRHIKVAVDLSLGMLLHVMVVNFISIVCTTQVRF